MSIAAGLGSNNFTSAWRVASTLSDQGLSDYILDHRALVCLLLSRCQAESSCDGHFGLKQGMQLSESHVDHIALQYQNSIAD